MEFAPVENKWTVISHVALKFFQQPCASGNRNFLLPSRLPLQVFCPLVMWPIGPLVLWSSALIKRRKKISSYMRKFRREQLQSHIELTASSYTRMNKNLRISSYIRKPFLICDFAISLYMRKIFFSFLSVRSCCPLNIFVILFSSFYPVGSSSCLFYVLRLLDFSFISILLFSWTPWTVSPLVLKHQNLRITRHFETLGIEKIGNIQCPNL